MGSRVILPKNIFPLPKRKRLLHQKVKNGENDTFLLDYECFLE